MKILLVSDSHGKLDYLRTVLEKVKPVDAVFHMGDVERDEEMIRLLAGCPVEFVAGNNDFLSQEPWDKVIPVAGHRILMTHGHRHGVSAGLDRLEAVARQEDAGIVLYGHTHVPDISYRGERVFVNPGSISLPRQEGHLPSYIILDIDRHQECHFSVNFLKTG